MEGLVNYSSEDEQDDYPYAKVAVRDRVRGGAAISGRTATESSVPPLKRSYEHSKSGSFDVESSYRKSRDTGNDRFKSGNTSFNEDKYKFDRRADKSRDHREKRDCRDTKNNRDLRDDDRTYDYSQKYDYKKHDDHKRFREPKRDYKRDANDYYRDDKRYNRYDEKKTAYATNNKDRFSSKSRYDDRKQYDDRFSDEKRTTNEDRRAGGSYTDDRRKEFNDRRHYNNDDDRKTDRRTQRSYNEERSNAYRPRRSNSPLPSHHHKINNKYSERKDDNSTRRERKRHSRSRTRSRSRSRSANNSNETNLESINSAHQRTEQGEHLGETNRPETESQTSEKKNLPTARNFAALLTLPLSENAPKHPNVIAAPASNPAAGSNTTNATVQLPSYYNPNVINPNKYVEQMQKRKLIWGAKKVEDSASKWGHAQFSQDQDGRVASKFMRLMGIKTATGTVGEPSTSVNGSGKKSPSTTPPNNPDVKSREAMFSTMEHQYEVARQVTHTMRGVGLGFSSQSRPF